MFKKFIKSPFLPLPLTSLLFVVGATASLGGCSSHDIDELAANLNKVSQPANDYNSDAPRLNEIKLELEQFKNKQSTEFVKSDLDYLDRLSNEAIHLRAQNRMDVVADIGAEHEYVENKVHDNLLPDRLLAISARDNVLLQKYGNIGPSQEFLKSRIGDEGLTVISFYDHIRRIGTESENKVSWSQDEGHWILTNQTRAPGQDSVEVTKFVFGIADHNVTTLQSVYDNEQEVPTFAIIINAEEATRIAD